MKTTAILSKSLLVLTVFTMMTFSAADQCIAQPAVNTNTYNTAIGVRLGETSGLSIKHFMDRGSSAIDGIIGIWPDAFSLTCLYEKHANAGIEGLTWYYGAGGHVFFESGSNRYYYRDQYYYYRRYYTTDGAGLGIDGVVGLEYKIRPVPFALSIDLKPFVESNTNGGLYVSLDPGFGIKFTF